MSFLSTGPFNHNRFAQLEEQRLREKMYFMEKKKMSKEDHKKAAKEGKRWQDSDGDGKWYEKGEDVKEDLEVVTEGCGDGCDCDACKAAAKKKMKKEDVTRDDVIDYLMESGFTNNPVSAEVLIDNMTDAWLEQIIDELQG